MQPKYWNQRRYTAWFTPLYRIRDAQYEHVDPSAVHLRPYIEEIKDSILVEGLHNPLCVTIKDGKARVHPGKCRAMALLELGWEEAPAIVVNYDAIMEKEQIEQPSIFLDDPEQAQSFFSGDCVVEMSHRFFTVKKRKE